jgi:autotransporter-associated beta strand protein
MKIRGDILADASTTGNGTGFLVLDTAVGGTYRALGGATGFASGEYNLTPTSWAGTQNAGINNSAQTISVNTAANSLTIGGTSSLGSGLNATAFGNFGPAGLLDLNLSNAAAFLALDGSTVNINVGAVGNTTAGTTLVFHTVGSSALNVNGYFGVSVSGAGAVTTNTGGFMKADNGVMNLNNLAFYSGATVVDGGTLNLNSGADNTVAVTPGVTTPVVSALTVNGVSAIVDLKNHNQAVGALASTNPLPGESGTVTNTGGSVVTLTSTGGGTFSGAINGNIAFTRAGNNTTLLTSASNYAGVTTVRGGTLQLRDSGSILNTASINLQYGILQIDQSGLNPIGTLNPLRVAANVGITMQGASLILTPGGSMDSAATVGIVALTGGANTITPTLLASQGSSNTLTIANLQTAALITAGGTVNIGAAVGQPGINQAELILSQVNGVAPTNATFLGVNVIANSNDYASYLTTQGVGAYGTTGFLTYAAALASGNNLATAVSAQGTATAIAAATTGGALHFAGTTASAITFTNGNSTGGTDTLNLALGGIMHDNTAGAVSIGTAAARGLLTTGGTSTSGTSSLVVYDAQNTITIESVIENNQLGSLTRLVKSGAGALTLTGPNTYTGGTVVDQGTLNLTATTAGAVVIPGDLVINGVNSATNTAVTMNTNAQQIATTSNVTINGGGTLTLVGTNTLNAVTFNNSGSMANPTVATNTLLILASANPVTATNDSLATTPVISGTALQFSNASPTITVSGLSPNSLQISAPITQNAGMTGPVIKSGAGALSLNGASTFTTGFTLNQGTLILGLASVGTPPSITSGPVGTGTLTIGDGTTIMGAVASATTIVVGNATTVNGNFTFGGVTANATMNNSLTLSGAMNLGATGRTITVSSPAVTGTISGVITSTATGTALTKAGNGILVLSNAGDSLAGAGVTVAGGVLKNGVANAIPNSSLLTVNAGAEYDMNAVGQISQQIAGAGVITDSGAAATFVVGGTSATDVATNVNSSFSGVITNSASALTLTKVGLGSLTLSGNSTYTGPTNIIAGSIVATVDNALPTTTALTIGTAATTVGVPASLDLTNANQAVASLATTVATTPGPNVIVGSGKTFTVNGNVTVGGNPAATATTTMVIAGSTPGVGTFNVATAAGGLLQVGGATAAVAENATLDLTGLAATSINVSATGTVRVNNVTATNTTGDAATFLLPTPSTGITATTPVSTITAGTFSVGDSASYNNGATPNAVVQLGSGLNTINANTINVGTGSRDIGSVTYNVAATNGAIKVRAADGASRAAFNIGTGAATTGTTGANNIVDLTGHNADLLLSALNVGNQARIGNLTSTFAFDTGTLDTTAVTIGFDNGANSNGAATLTDNVNIGGGTVTIGSGGVAMGSVTDTSTSAKPVVGNLNISGGTVTIANAGTFAVRLGNNTAASGLTSVNDTLNITGGTVTLAGDIIKGSATRTTANLILDGGTLDMGGHNIGGATALDSVALRTGTLQNVAQINNGGAVSKSVAGTLIVAGTNTWTGPTNVSNGILQLNGGGAPTLGNTAVAITGTAGLSVHGATTVGTVAGGSINIGGGLNLSLVDATINTLTLVPTTGTGLTMGAASNLNLEFNSPGSGNNNTTFDQINLGNQLALGGNVVVNLTNLNALLPTNGNYTLMTYANSTLGGNQFTFTGGATTLQIGGGRSETLVTNGTSLVLQVIDNGSTPAYWSGARLDGSWATITSPQNQTNWATDHTGATDLNQIPGVGAGAGLSNVIFTTDAATNLSTTLDGNYDIASLTFTGTGTTADATGVTIASGTGGAGANNVLTIENGGIIINSSTAAHAISANVQLGASQLWNNNSAGTFTVSGGINTNGFTVTVGGSGPTTLSGVISGAGGLTENAIGASTLTLSGASANTYSGLTTVTGGVLDLNKTAGTNAIIGDGASSKLVFDILINGSGTLKWDADNQLDDSVSINMTGGNLNLNGHAETFYDFTNSGGTFTTGAGSNLTITDPTWSGGTNTISNDSTATFTTLNISGGTNTVQGAGAGVAGGVLNVGSGGLNFSDGTNPTLTINSDASSAGKVVLAGPVTSTVNSGQALIASGGAATNPGTLDLGGARRSFSVTGTAPLVVSAPVTGTGATTGIDKAGSGTLVLAGANTYAGDTNVNAGKVVVSGSLAGNVNVASGATLAGGANAALPSLSSQVAAIVAHSDINGGGTVAPGDSGGSGLASIGQLNASGNVTLGDSLTTGVAHLSIEIGGNQDGAGVGAGGPNTTNSATLQYDRLTLAGGTLNLTNANLDVTAVNSFGYTSPTYDTTQFIIPADGHIFFLITGASAINGTFMNAQGTDANFPGFSTMFGTDGQEFAISYSASFSGGTFTGGNDVAVMAIPEPNSMSMLAGSLGLALGLQRFRRRRK